jgi:hypothetical protein
MQLAELIRGALLLQSGTAAGASLAQALLIVLLAGLSTALGQSVMLLASRVAPRRFLGSLFVQAFIFSAGFLLWSLTIWLGSRYFFDADQAFNITVIAIGVGYSPFLLSLFVLVPYLGSFFSLLLSVWALLAILVTTRDLLDLTLLQTLVTGGFGWLLLHLLNRLAGGPLLQFNSMRRRQVRRIELPETQLPETARQPGSTPGREA